jgi:signal peptidase I
MKVKYKLIITFQLFCITLLLVLTSGYPLAIMTGNGNSMQPTLQDGCILLYAKIPTRYNVDDLVIFEYKDANLCKRIVGVEGSIIDGEVVPENTVYVLGDNRDFSLDSRIIGYVPIPDIVGKVLYHD